MSPRTLPAVAAAIVIWLSTAGVGAGSGARVRTGSTLQIARDLGVTELLTQFFGSVGVIVFAALTQLGDVWFLFLLAGSLYFASAHADKPLARQRGAFVLALPIIYIVTVQALKGVFMLPRPPGAGVAATIPWIPALLVPVFENSATADGYGFPSGHALGTTLVWGGAALITEYQTRRVRFGIASIAVVLMSFSRLALGVHYLVDVIAGTAIGAALLYGVYRLTNRGTEPGRAFLTAIVIGLVGLANTISFDSAAAFGGAIGAGLAWYALVDHEIAPARTQSVTAVSVAILVLTALLFAGLYVWAPSAPIAVLGSALAAAALVGTPDVGDRLVSVLSRRDRLDG